VEAGEVFLEVGKVDVAWVTVGAQGLNGFGLDAGGHGVVRPRASRVEQVLQEGLTGLSEGDRIGSRIAGQMAEVDVVIEGVGGLPGQTTVPTQALGVEAAP
jgi:hypothetical protein